MRTALVLVVVLAAACGRATVPAAAGESCGPDRGCDDGLTCRASVCFAIAGGGGGTAGGDDPVQVGGHGGGAAGGSANGGSNGGGSSGGGSSGGGSANCSAACDAPPTSCHARQGTCQQGLCVYGFVTGASCDDGDACTVGDTCENNACRGTPLACTTPPARVCLNATDLRTYDAQGVCQGGLCVYSRNTVTCGSGGCSGGACQTDACANVTCNSPPSVCYAGPGTCQTGSCTYAFANGATCDDHNACTDNDRCSAGGCLGVPKTCNAPPANTCENATTAKVWSSSGSCAAGQCAYTFQFVSCPTGCNAGHCNGSGWTKMTSNTTTKLYSVWGSSANAVWAVGDNGTAAFWNGAQWQLRATPAIVQTQEITSIHGSAADNVFAYAPVSKSLLRFDGVSWSHIATLNQGGYDYVGCVYAYGPNDVFVWGDGFLSGPGAVAAGHLTRVTNGTVTELGSFAGRVGAFMVDCGIRVVSPTEVYVNGGGWHVMRYDGTATLKPVGTTNLPTVWGFYAFDASNIFTFSSSSLGQWNGTSWMSFPLGAGSVTNVSGTSTSRVFASVQLNTTTGQVAYFDGVGWTQEPLPAGTLPLQGIWAAPTGEVFAVGDMGTILKGP